MVATPEFLDDVQTMTLEAFADTIVPDFPLTNKSFNLSYAGHDL